MADYQTGFVSGWQAAQPKWINASDHLPDADGKYWKDLFRAMPLEYTLPIGITSGKVA